MMSLRYKVWLTCAVLIVCAGPLYAQSTTSGCQQPLVQEVTAMLEAEQVVKQPAGAPPTPRHTGIKALVKDLGNDITHLPSKENLFWAGLGGGLALAAHPFDDNVNQSLTNSDFAKSFFRPGEVIGELPTLLTLAVTTYAVGRIGDKPKVSHLGMDLIQALAISEMMVQTLKYTTRRERPDGSGKN